MHMFVHTHQWLEPDVRIHLGQLCINEATMDGFLSSCRRHIVAEDHKVNPQNYTEEEIADTATNRERNPDSYKLPGPPAMWSIGATEVKVEGIMHLSMGIQKKIFKFIIRWASGHNLGSALQRRLAAALRAVQQLNVAYCPCRPYKDDKFGGYTAETYRAMTMISLAIYRVLLEADLQPKPPRGPNTHPPEKWTKQDNFNWMHVRGIEHSMKSTAPEAQEQVRRELAKRPQLPVIYELPTPITTDETRDLVWRMFNMFRAIFCTDLAGEEAKNRSTASVMRFLTHIEDLDLRLTPKRLQPIWITKYNFLGLPRACESFEIFHHVRNLYEGGEIGEGMVKQLRPFVAKGMHTQWATNLLLRHYRNWTLNILIDAAEDGRGKKRGCLLGRDVETSKFKRFNTTAEIDHLINNGRPIPVLLYGSAQNWIAGAIIKAQNNWCFQQILFPNNGDILDDPFGMTCHRIQRTEQELCLGPADGPRKETISHQNLKFWGCALLFAEEIEDTINYRYAIVRSDGWQYLNGDHEWSEHE